MWVHSVGRGREALAAGEEAVILYRALAADNPAHQGNLALVLDNLGILLDQVRRHEEALAARAESVGIYRELASENPEIYEERYRRTLSALRREYDQRGMQHEAVVHDLVRQRHFVILGEPGDGCGHRVIMRGCVDAR